MKNTLDWVSDNLKIEYETHRSLYEKLCTEVVRQLQALLSQAGITSFLPIEYRIKSWESICNKCERNRIRPKSLSEITDLSGIRIILLFQRDMQGVRRIIENNFEIIHKEDAQQRLEANQFGYGSTHFIVAPPKTWFNVPTLRLLKGIHAELQVRTASQHIWAAASHILQYKKESDVPIPVRRSINRVAALLETVDLEFERALSKRNKYIAQIKRASADEPLNVDLLKRTLDRLLPEKNTYAERENYTLLLEELRAFGIRSARNLEMIITRHWPKIKYEEAQQLREAKMMLEKGLFPFRPFERERVERGVYFTHFAMVRSALEHEFGQKFRDFLSEGYKKWNKKWLKKLRKKN